ncbi:MAG: DUF58 domain-containing protein, partial [Gemmataceae bacterium]
MKREVSMPVEMKDALAAGARAGLRYALGLPRQAPRGTAGASVGLQAGSSLEFKDFRDYQPGDDLRHIDWNAFARSDQLFVKLYREEVTPHLDLFIDGTRSMDLEGSAKGEAALGLAAFFATAAENAGFSHGTWLVGDNYHPVLNGHGRPATWQDLTFPDAANPLETIRQAPPPWRPRSVRILISDLFRMGDPLSLLEHQGERAGAVVIVQLLAEADASPPEGETLRLVDTETGQTMELLL